MEILYENPGRKPTVSLVLLDWSVRESFHMLDYLNEQSVTRDAYEVVWIEYYGRRSDEIRKLISRAQDRGASPPLDVWLVMDVPENLNYHKHLMYNVGIILSRGNIVCICDSDAAVRPTFVKSIISSFEEDRNIVLHMDELRSIDRRFYPYNYPPLQEVERTAENLRGGKPHGLTDKEDPLHSLNYGACMCALREDLIAIGGADEHMDYLGHVCGPYEMTFRLQNAGKREVWHQSEWLYHTWHPGQAGIGNYIGPNDGLHISTTALDAKKSGRTMPLNENPAIKKLRAGEGSVDIAGALNLEEIKKWAIGEVTCRQGKGMLKWLNPLYGPSGKTQPNLGIKTAAGIHLVLLGMFIKQTAEHIWQRMDHPGPATARAQKDKAGLAEVDVEKKGVIGKLQNLWRYMVRRWMHNRYMAGECAEMLERLGAENIAEVAVFGSSDISRIISSLSRRFKVPVAGYYSIREKGKIWGIKVRPLDEIRGYGGKVLIASFTNLMPLKAALTGKGIISENIILFL